MSFDTARRAAARSRREAAARAPQGATAAESVAGRAECLEHLRAARVAALRAGMVIVAAQVQTLILAVER